MSGAHERPQPPQAMSPIERELIDRLRREAEARLKDQLQEHPKDDVSARG